MARVSGIYKITCLVNNKIYIGSSVDIHNRWSVHKRDFKNNKHCNKHFQNAWNKYGKDNFNFSVIEIVNNINKLIKREQFWLDYYQSYQNDIGYNIRKIADNNIGFKHSEETKKRIGELSAKVVRNPCTYETKLKISKQNTGKKRTEEAKQKMSLAKLGKPLSEYHRLKISLSNMGKPATKGRSGIPHTADTKNKISIANKGKKLSVETRTKISNSLKGRKNLSISKKVICINTLRIYESITEANNDNNTSKIGECCKGYRKSAGKNPKTGEKLKWMYYEDYIEQQNKENVA